jgi:hypothetical protein
MLTWAVVYLITSRVDSVSGLILLIAMGCDTAMVIAFARALR